MKNCKNFFCGRGRISGRQFFGLEILLGAVMVLTGTALFEETFTQIGLGFFPTSAGILFAVLVALALYLNTIIILARLNAFTLPSRAKGILAAAFVIPNTLSPIIFITFRLSSADRKSKK